MQCVAADETIEDMNYYLRKALTRGAMDIDSFLKVKKRGKTNRFFFYKKKSENILVFASTAGVDQWNAF